MVGSGEVGSGENVVAVRTIRLDRAEDEPTHDEMHDEIRDDDPTVRVVVKRRFEDDDEHDAGSGETDAGEGEDERMTTAEERMMILRMVEQGKINAEEGARLLAALGNRAQGAPGGSAPAGRSAGRSGRIFRVRVTDNLTGRQKVNVDIPLALAEIGLRLVPKSAGINVESIRQALDAGIEGRIVDVVDHEDGQRVEVFIE